MSDIGVSLTLKLNDQGSGAAQRALKVVERSLKDVETAAKSSGAAAISAFKKLADAREVLGVRAEKTIQNEIRQTEAAYRRLAASGTASARELARAQDAMRAKVAGLRAEMEGAAKAGLGLGGVLKGAMGVGAGYMAGKAVLSGPISQTMGYDRQLANLANTAYAGESIGARRTGMRTLDAAVIAAVRAGGGTREGALGTLDEMVASGAFTNVGEAANMLPTLTKAGTAAGADPRDLARIAIRAKQTFGITNMPLALDQALRAGQLGGFELKDMAKWLPQQMAMATNVGMKGESGFRTLLAANEAAVISAGTKDEAGNNVRDLLNEINTPHFALHLKKVGVDGNGSLLKMQERGVNKLEGTVALVREIIDRDPKYKALQEKLKDAPSGERAGIVEAMATQVKGTVVGKVFHNQQSLMALLAIMNNAEVFQRVMSGTGNAKGANDDNHALIAETASYKAEMLAAEKAIAMQKALDQVNPLLGNFAEGLTDLMREWPTFSAAVVGGGTAIIALAGAATAASLALLAVAKTAPGGGIPVPGTISSTAKKVLDAAKPVATVGGAAVLPLAAMYGVSEWAGDTSHDEERVSWRKRIGESLTGLFGDPTASARERYEAQRAELGPQEVKVTVDVKNGNIVAEVNKANARDAARK